jgi:hypothetical protein
MSRTLLTLATLTAAALGGAASAGNAGASLGDCYNHVISACNQTNHPVSCSESGMDACDELHSASIAPGAIASIRIAAAAGRPQGYIVRLQSVGGRTASAGPDDDGRGDDGRRPGRGGTGSDEPGNTPNHPTKPEPSEPNDPQKPDPATPNDPATPDPATPNPDPKPEAQPESKPKPEDKPKPQRDPKPEPKPDPKPRPDPKPKGLGLKAPSSGGPDINR